MLNSVLMNSDRLHRPCLTVLSGPFPVELPLSPLVPPPALTRSFSLADEFVAEDYVIADLLRAELCGSASATAGASIMAQAAKWGNVESVAPAVSLVDAMTAPQTASAAASAHNAAAALLGPAVDITAHARGRYCSKGGKATKLRGFGRLFHRDNFNRVETDNNSSSLHQCMFDVLNRIIFCF
jgi:hypothetical protein